MLLLILFRAELSTMTSLRNTMLQSSLTASVFDSNLVRLKDLKIPNIKVEEHEA